MSSERKSAIWIGVLWILATVLPASSIVAWSALDDGEGILANAATHKNQLITWALLNLAGAVAAAGVAFMFYPILNRAADTSVKKGLALWYWAPGSLRAVCTSWPCSPPGRPSR